MPTSTAASRIVRSRPRLAAGSRLDPEFLQKLGQVRHSGWLHLFGNLLIFSCLGPFLEDVYGRVMFLLLYLASGLAALATHAVYFAGSALPLLVVPLFRVHLLIPGYVLLPVWFLVQHWSYHADEGSAVAYWAHVGGFSFGLVVAGLIRLLRIEERFINPSIEKKISMVQDPALERANEARLAGDLATARREVRKALVAAPRSLDAWSESCQIAMQAGDTAELERAAPKLLELYAQAGESRLADLFIREVVEEHPQLAGPRLLMTFAGHYERSGDTVGALLLYERVVELCPGQEAAAGRHAGSAALLAPVRSSPVPVTR